MKINFFFFPFNHNIIKHNLENQSSKNMIFSKKITFIISLFLASFVILLYYSDPLTFKPTNNSSLVAKDELQIALEKASMPNKTLIIAIVNKAYVENDDPTMFDLFLEGFWAGEGTSPLLDHLLVVTMDRAAQRRCKFRRLNCYRLTTDVDFAGEKVYMTEGFIEMMWQRTRFLLDVLNRGFSFIFTDTDVLWLRNPFTLLSNNETLDLQISTTWYNPNLSSKIQHINTGFYFIRPNERTISLFETWYGMRKNTTGMKEQDVLEDLIKGGVLEKLGLRTKFLDTLYFSGFCEDSRDVERVSTVHANCCKSIKAKVADLKMVLVAWKCFKREKNKGSTNNITDFRWPIHKYCINSGLMNGT